MDSSFLTPLDPHRRVTGRRRPRISANIAVLPEDEQSSLSRANSPEQVSPLIINNYSGGKSTTSPSDGLSGAVTTPSIEYGHGTVEPTSTVPRHSPTNLLYRLGHSSPSARSGELQLKAPIPSSRFSGRATVSPSPHVSRRLDGASERHPSNSPAEYAADTANVVERAVAPPIAANDKVSNGDTHGTLGGRSTPSISTPAPSIDAGRVEKSSNKPLRSITPGEIRKVLHDERREEEAVGLEPAHKNANESSKPRIIAATPKVIVDSDDSEPPKRLSGKKKFKSAPIVYSEPEDEAANGQVKDGLANSLHVQLKSSKNKRQTRDDDEESGAESRVSAIPNKRSRSKFHDEAEAMPYRVNPTRGAKTRANARSSYPSLVDALGSTIEDGYRRPKTKQIAQEVEEPHDDGTGDAWLRRWCRGHHGKELWPGFDPNHDDWKDLALEDNPNGVDEERYPLPVATTRRIPERYLKGIGYVEDQKTNKKEALNYDTMYEGAVWINDNFEAELTLARAKVQSVIQGRMAILEAFSDPTVNGSLSNKAMKALHGVASLANLKAVIEVGGLLFAQEEFKRLRCVFARMACNEVMASGVEEGKTWPMDLPPHDAMFEHARRVHTPPPEDVEGYDEIEMEAPGRHSKAIDDFAMLSADVRRFLENTVDSVSIMNASTRASATSFKTRSQSQVHSQRRSESRTKSQAIRRHLSSAVSRVVGHEVEAEASTSRRVGYVNSVASGSRHVENYYSNEVTMGGASQPRASQINSTRFDDEDVAMDSVMDEDEVYHGSPMKGIDKA